MPLTEINGSNSIWYFITSPIETLQNKKKLLLHAGGSRIQLEVYFLYQN